MKALFHLTLATMLLGAAFGYGFWVAREKIFPYGAISRVLRGPEVERAAAESAPPPVERKGWFERTRQPKGAEVDEAIREMDKLGYGQSYEADGGRRVGVTVHDAARSYQGYNLIVSAHRAGAVVTDMEGSVLKEWRYDYADLPPSPDYRPAGTFGTEYWRRVHLFENGDLLAVYDRTALIKIDRNSRLIWALHGDYHHDLDVTEDGTIWVLTREERIVPRFDKRKPTVEDFITRVSPDGRVLGRMSLLRAFETSVYDSLLHKAERGGDIFHTNSLEVFEGEPQGPLFGPGKALVSLWGLDAIAVVNLNQEKVVWALSGMWHRQHEPVVLEGGNLLLFDNMGHGGMSKVIEIEPFEQRVVWAYEGDEENDFYSALCGSTQRLPNGNTLITESLSGRAFEVTRDKEVVWRWESPYRVGPRGEGVAVLMEVIRLEPDYPVDRL